MKQLILIKQSNSIHLAHLYEHIFCTQLNRFFYDNHLFLRLDYSLIGKTYNSGVICIELELYTKAALLHAKQIDTFNITVDKTSISTAASQLLAEEERPFDSTGYDNVKLALENLHKLPWQNIDDLEQLGTRTVRRKAYPFYIAEGDPLPARKLAAKLSLDSDFAQTHRELLPLFYQIAWFIAVNARRLLTDAYGYYSSNDSFETTKQKTNLLSTLKVAHAHDTDVDLSANLKTYLDAVQNIQQYNGFASYMSELREISYYNHPNLAPNLEKNYEDTHIMIGSKGWQQIATPENCELLLKYISVELKFGRGTVSQSLVKL